MKISEPNQKINIICVECVNCMPRLLLDALRSVTWHCSLLEYLLYSKCFSQFEMLPEVRFSLLLYEKVIHLTWKSLSSVCEICMLELMYASYLLPLQLFSVDERPPLLVLILYSSKENALWNYAEYYIENSYSWVNTQYRRLLDPLFCIDLPRHALASLFRFPRSFWSFVFVSWHLVFTLLWAVPQNLLSQLVGRGGIQLSKIDDVCLIIIWKFIINVEVIYKENIYFWSVHLQNVSIYRCSSCQKGLKLR